MPSSVHISLNVSDLDQSVDFYRRFLGEPVKLQHDYANCWQGLKKHFDPANP